MRAPTAAAAAVVSLLGTERAFASGFAEAAGSVYAGLVNPLLVPAHVMALVGLGLFVAQQKKTARRIILLVFAAALAGGIALIVAAFAAIDSLLYLLAAAGVTGLLVAVGRPLPPVAGAALAAAVGVALEFDSVPQTISIQASVIMLAGTAITAFILAMTVAELTADAERPWLRIGMRVVGSWIAASAVLVLALFLAR